MVWCAVLFAGCDNARKIETAAIIENVSVDKRGDALVYTFYRLTGDDRPWGTEIPASSFEEACRLADESYIPHLSLAKLELLMISEDACDAVLRRDVDFIATQPSFSPVAYVTLCDDATMSRFRETNRAQRLIEEQLILLKKNHPAVRINYLSVCNSLARPDERFFLPMIRSDPELRVCEREIDTARIK